MADDEFGPFGGPEEPPPPEAEGGTVIDLEAARVERSMAEWNGRLVKTDKHVVLPIVANALVLLANLPMLRGLVGFNEFTNEPQLLRPPPPAEPKAAPMPGPYPRAWTRADVVLVQAALQRAWNPKFSAETVEDAMISQAWRNPFHPIRDWLAGLRWDGKPRLENWLAKAFGEGPEDTDDMKEARRKVGTKFLLAAVRRVREPGCKFDQMLVLEGLQGQGKSSALQALFGEAWFTDDLQDLHSKEGAISLQGAWGVEVGELDKLLRVDNETVKAFLSRQVDRYRPTYGKRVLAFPRQVVLAGTTNRSDWMRDETGNRRYWPVKTYYAEVDWIRENREQLWAEAAQRERSGEVLYLDDEDAQRVMRTAQEARMAEDVWAEPIADWIDRNAHEVYPQEVTVPRLLDMALGMARDRQDKRAEMRVAAILTQWGWTRTFAYGGGSKNKRRVWRPPEVTETDQETAQEG